MSSSLFFSVLALLSLPFVTAFSVGCAAAGDDTAGASASAADSVDPADAGAVASTLWCLEPAGHVVNGVDVVWTVDVTSAFGPPRDRFVVKDQGFYWHGPLMTQTAAPTASWKMTTVDETQGFKAHAESTDGSIDVDLVGDPNVGFAGVTGTLHVQPNSGPEQTIDIVRGHRCPRRIVTQ